mmetsp:Transcript_33648/g.51915  ORF Transcript_33648/g.51915 Transcript_33648/m.51915 type:complete len:177 (-) Transcript_33648:1143-1673(-)
MKAARDHINDIAPKGITSGKGSDGSAPTDRIQKYGLIDEAWAESSLYGVLNTKEVIERLIVCDGQPKRGFRQSMFSDELKMCGVGTALHISHDNMVQIEYVNKLLAEGEMKTINIINSGAVSKAQMNDMMEKQGLGKAFNVKANKSPPQGGVSSRLYSSTRISERAKRMSVSSIQP